MILTGIARIGNEPELKYTSTGTAVTNINAAFTVGWGDQKDTTWITCSLWGKQAEALTEYLNKGNQIGLTLEDVKLDTYKGRDGTEKASLTAKIIKVELIGGQTQSGNTETKQAAKPAEKEPFETSADDIPF
jgi:single-strand DNA-binding protein